MKIEFYIPKNETIPTDLRLLVDNIYVTYERIVNGFRFIVSTEDEDFANKIVGEIIAKIKEEHEEPEHGVSWRTVSIETVPQDERYKLGTIIEWKYRVRDSY